MFQEDDCLQLSAIQHFLFCKRQCALIHIEQVWQENIFTAEGRVMHEKAHEEQFENHKDLRIERGIIIHSLKLGLIGKTDVIEFHKKGETWLPFPVEYKRGKPKENDCDRIQLCAQAICVEEMMNCHIPAGALFYGKIRKRQDVGFSETIRKKTEETAAELHEFINEGHTPVPEYSKKCESCSLVSICLPKKIAGSYGVRDYISEALKAHSV